MDFGPGTPQGISGIPQRDGADPGSPQGQLRPAPSPPIYCTTSGEANPFKVLCNVHMICLETHHFNWYITNVNPAILMSQLHIQHICD